MFSWKIRVFHQTCSKKIHKKKISPTRERHQPPSLDQKSRHQNPWRSWIFFGVTPNQHPCLRISLQERTRLSFFLLDPTADLGPTAATIVGIGVNSGCGIGFPRKMLKLSYPPFPRKKKSHGINMSHCHTSWKLIFLDVCSSSSPSQLWKKLVKLGCLWDASKILYIIMLQIKYL